jgi:hypothetical protein
MRIIFSTKMQFFWKPFTAKLFGLFGSNNFPESQLLRYVIVLLRHGRCGIILYAMSGTPLQWWRWLLWPPIYKNEMYYVAMPKLIKVKCGFRERNISTVSTVQRLR